MCARTTLRPILDLAAQALTTRGPGVRGASPRIKLMVDDPLLSRLWRWSFTLQALQLSGHDDPRAPPPHPQPHPRPDPRPWGRQVLHNNRTVQRIHLLCTGKQTTWSGLASHWRRNPSASDRTIKRLRDTESFTLWQTLNNTSTFA